MDKNHKPCLKEELGEFLICDCDKNKTQEVKEVSISNKSKIPNPKEDSYKYTKIQNNNIIKKVKSNLICIFFLISFIIVLSSMVYIYSSSKTKNNNKTKKEKRKLEHAILEFELKVNDIGTQNILNNDFSDNPSQIIIINRTGDEKVLYEDFNERSINITDKEDTIKLVYDLNNSDTLNCEKMFLGTDITEINIKEKNNARIESMVKMFESCQYLSSVNINNLNFSKIETMEEMFKDCKLLSSIDLSNVNMRYVKSTKKMFSGCTSLTLINFTKSQVYELETMEYMFENCESLTLVKIFIDDLENLNNMEHSFENCFSLESINLNGFRAEYLKYMNYMFNGCSKLKSIDLKNDFVTYRVEEMEGLFSGCESLSSIDLSEFYTGNVKNMYMMFYNCQSLEQIDLSNFNFESAKNMSFMFYDCHKLTSIEINLENSLVTTIDYMFYNCYLIKSISLINFNMSELISFTEVFSECRYLEYINMSKSELNLDIANPYNDIIENAVICTEKGDQNMLYIFINNSSCLSYDCTDDWNINRKKIVYDLNMCVDSCNKEDNNILNIPNFNYFYEYENHCYDNCPGGTYVHKDNNYRCTNIYSDSLEYYETEKESEKEKGEEKFENEKEKSEKEKGEEKSEKEKNESKNDEENEKEKKEDSKSKSEEKELIQLGTENVKEKEEIIKCNPLDFFNNICIPNTTNEKQEESISDYSYSSYIKQKIEDLSLKPILEECIQGKKNFINSVNNVTYQISTISSQYSTNLSTIDLDEIELEIKQQYGIDLDEPLILLKEEHYIEGIKIPIIEYSLFTKEGVKLNISSDNNFKVTYSIPVIRNESEVFIHNPKSDFYQDKCSTFSSKDNTDMTIYDRKNDYNKNYLSLCQSNCEYKGYNSTTKKVDCECNMNTDSMIDTFHIDKDKLLSKFMDFKQNSNIFIISCHKTVFNKEGLAKNIGSYITILIILGVFVDSIIFAITGFKNFKIKIYKLLYQKAVNSKTETNIKSQNEKFGTGENNLNNLDSANKIIDNYKLSKNNNFPLQGEALKGYEKNIDFDNDFEINNLDYRLALEYDKRTFIQYYFSLIRTNHLLVFTFYTKSDYNSRLVKLSLFIFTFSLSYAVNALFFNDSTMHKIYEDKGEYNFIYQIPIIIYSAIISAIIKVILSLLISSEKTAIKIKHIENRKAALNEANIFLKNLKIKMIIFFILTIIILVVFWYYLACFGAVYKNTQITLIKDTIISFCTSFIYPFFIELIPCVLRITALRAKKRDKECLYKISLLSQLL